MGNEILGYRASVESIEKWDENQMHEAINQIDTGGLKITGRHFEYTVTTDERGEVKVNVSKSPFYATQRMKDSARERAEKIEWAFRAHSDYNSLRSQQENFELASLKPHTTQKVVDAVIDKLPKNDPEVAVYGVGARTNLIEVLRDGMGNNARVSTIDRYNTNLGVNAHSTAKDLLNLANDAKTKTLVPQMKKKYENNNPWGVSKPRLYAWADYLEQNAERLDILGKVRKLHQLDQPSKQEGTSGTGGNYLARYLLKNLPFGMIRSDPSFDQQAWANAQTPEDRFEVIKNLAVYQELLVAAEKDEAGEEFDLSTVADKFIQIAFFRETSKMGLEFFASQGVPIVFLTEKQSAPQTEREEMTASLVHTKPWKRGETRESFHEPITYSEVRKVDRLRNGLDRMTMKHRNMKMPVGGINVIPVLNHFDRRGRYVRIEKSEVL